MPDDVPFHRSCGDEVLLISDESDPIGLIDDRRRPVARCGRVGASGSSDRRVGETTQTEVERVGR